MGWGDHYSSDEEDIQERPFSSPPPQTGQPESKGDSSHEEKQYNWPTVAPYTAYVGNLPTSCIVTEDDLASQITQLASQHAGGSLDLKVVNVRLVKSHPNSNNTGKALHRGFGYVEFETLEELQTVVTTLNQVAVLDGKTLQLDAARSPNQAIRRRGRRTKEGGDKPQQQQQPVPQHRTSLKLQPRSKPISAAAADGSSKSDIFGGGKARDDATWRERKKEDSNNNNGHNNHKRKDHKDNRRGRKSHNSTNNNNNGISNNQTKVEKPAVEKSPTPKAPEKVVPPKPSTTLNKFAALGFDSDSD